MAKAVQEFLSPAKLNLRLDVLHKRKDGYHELRMLNVLIDLCDRIRIGVVEKGIFVSVQGDPLVPAGEQNLVYRAAKEVLAYSNKNIGVEIDLHKQIPSGAGLGGGSSNAATTILGLNQILKIGLSKEKLLQIGLKLGSDVPFFLFGKHAIAGGIGEKLVRVKSIPKMNFIVIVPRISVSSSWVYSEYRGEPKTDLPELPLIYRTKKAVAAVVGNDLESVTARRCPVVERVKAALLHCGAMVSQMTGSGAGVFGLYGTRLEAEKALAKIQKEYTKWRCYLAETV